MKVDGFLLALLAAVALAIAWPEIGAAGGWLPLATITGIGIGLVFFLHGANLSGEALRSGAANWRLHLFIQASTFLLFPAIGLAVFLATDGALPPEMRLGFFFLCAICSTISSSVALVGIAKGNVSAAIFNASLSGLLGMILTPLLVGLVSTAASGELSLLDSIGDIGLKLLLPFALGQIIRPLLTRFLARNRKWVTKLDRLVILLIVYSSFCNSTVEGLWSRYSTGSLLLMLAMVTLLFVTVLAITTLLSRFLRFSIEDEITAVFCGSKKSLANGAPIAKILFGSSPALGMILLPLMLYHQVQLVICSMLAKRYAERPLDAASTVTPSAAQ